MTERRAHLRIGIDTGGTFTDIVCVDGASGAMRVTKVASTPANPAIGLVRGVKAILDAGGASFDDLAGLAHGTTVATNALLQGEIAGLGLIVTEGFSHILEIARQAVPEGYGNSYFWVKPERIVPLRYVREVGGRLNFRGRELRTLNEQDVRAAARFFRAQGIKAVGVCLLHSYANAAHERRVAEIVAEEYPDCTISLSCDVLPEYREYERAVTTLVDAFVKPHMGRYLERIRDELGPGLREKPFLVMQSSGGVASPDQVMCKPITTALSGPAAGALGSAVIAEMAGFPNVVTLDAGGTSTDLCLIESARPHVTNGGAVGPFPVRIPMIDIETIGTGGGSIAWISREGHLKVGPRSAGAEPGPMCYPNGGNEPTITDANLVLGAHPAGADRGRHSPRRRSRARGHRGARGAASRQHERGTARGRHHRDRQLEPVECHQADDHPARDRSARIRAALVRRLRSGAISRRHGPDRHEGLHRAAQSRQPLGLRTAGRRLAHRPHRDQGHARGCHRPRGGRGHLRRSRDRRRRDPRARRHRTCTHPARARGRRALCRAVHGSARAGALAVRSTLRSSTVWSLRSTPPISRPSATTTPASRRWSWSISPSPVSE